MSTAIAGTTFPRVPSPGQDDVLAVRPAAGQQGLPRLRRLPVPVAQPRPALRVVRDEDEIPAAQGMLALPLPGGDADADTGSATAATPGSSPATHSAAAPSATARPARVGAATAHSAPVRSATIRSATIRSAPGAPGLAQGQDAGRSRSAVTEERADDFARRRRTSGQLLPDPGKWTAQFVQAAVEVTNGLRPASQLRRWTSDEVHGMLVRRAGLTRSPANRGSTERGSATRSTPGSPAARNSAPVRGAAARTRQTQRSVVRSTRVCVLRDGVVEACAVVLDGPRVRAVALRLEGLDGRWRVTALQIG